MTGALMNAVSLADQLRAVVAQLRMKPIPLAALIPLMQDAADELDKSHQREREFSAQAARQVETAAETEGDDVTEFQLITMDENGDEELMAAASGPRAEALFEIMRYATSCTVPVTLYEVARVPVDLSVMSMGHA